MDALYRDKFDLEIDKLTQGSTKIPAQTVFKMMAELIKITRQRKDGDVTLNILKVLGDNLPIIASSFYTVNNLANTHEDAEVEMEASGTRTSARLNLRAQIGLSYSEYKSFSLGLDSTAGECLLTSKIESYPDVSRRKDYRDKSLCERFALKKMMAVPLYASRPGESSEEQAIGVICLYPKQGVSMAGLKRIMAMLSPIISEIYILEIDREQLRFRSVVTRKAVASVDLNSFLFRVCRVLKEEWPYEAISVLMNDDRAGQLRLSASTGVLGDRPKIEVLIDPQRNECSESDCFNLGVPVLEMYSGSELVIDRNSDKVNSVIAARVLLPIFEPSSNGVPKRPIGVLRVTNKLLKHDGRTEIFYFGWEDIEFLGFVCDVLGVIAAMLNRVSSSKDDFERALHGVQNNLVGLIGTLEFITVIAGRNLEQSKYHYMLPTASVQLQALSWQVDRFARREFVDAEDDLSCNLLVDVFAKLGPIIRPLGVSLSIVDLELPNFNDVLSGVPNVRINPKDALIVFRNLFENALKYAHPKKRAKIELKWLLKDGVVCIEFSDYGIGIVEKDKDRVFNEGYRSEDAIRRRSTGAGLGLHQCKELLRRTRGDIVLASSVKPTKFLISIEVFK